MGGFLITNDIDALPQICWSDKDLSTVPFIHYPPFFKIHVTVIHAISSIRITCTILYMLCLTLMVECNCTQYAAPTITFVMNLSAMNHKLYLLRLWYSYIKLQYKKKISFTLLDLWKFKMDQVFYNRQALAFDWFLGIVSVRTSMCVHLSPRLLITSGVMWHDMDSIWLVIQALWLL